MSNADIERLVQDRSLIRQSFDDEQVTGYRVKAMASLSDARAPGVSVEGSYLMAYTAALQAALAVLAAHDLKVRGTSNHYLSCPPEAERNVAGVWPAVRCTSLGQTRSRLRTGA